MKVKSENLIKDVGSSFRVLRFDHMDQLNRISGLHWHPEYEIIYISGGDGKRFIDGKVTYYEDGDLIFLGPNIIHTGFKECILQGHVQVVVQFQNLFGNGFLNHVELSPLIRLLENANSGLLFSQSLREQLSPIFEEIDSTSNFEKFFQLIQILKEMALDDYTSLNCNQSFHLSNPKEKSRFRKILAYIEKHFQDQPKLEEAAALINMHPTAFCRFIKLNSSKTFTEIVNDYRIQQSCTLLIESDLTIPQIAYESGFETLSFFYKKFKQYTNTTPNEYRHMYHA